MTSYHQRDWAGKLVSPSSHHQDDPAPPVQSSQPAPKQKQKAEPQAKKLRFITSQGAPQAKRRRVSTACLVCRKRKVACSGERPHCSTCTNNRLECTGYADDGSSGNVNGDEVETPRVSAPSLNRSATAESIKAPPPRKQKTTIPKPRSQSTGFVSNNSVPADPGHIRPQPSRVESEQSYFPRPSIFSNARNRMPYFRWLGPTAIMPGFKQMVVKVNRSSSMVDGVTSPSTGAQPGASGMSNHSATYDSDARTPQVLPFYDNSSMPPSELITHLCETFFTHLACNFPFLQRDTFMKDLEEKQVDTILVDAVCALAARFSTHQLIVEQAREGHAVNHSEQGSAFAHRAKVALIETYATPSVAAVQAALLLAYNEFGESRDSGLWMYLGISIRLAQDLGLHKRDGLRYEGRYGSSPKYSRQEKDLERSLGRINSQDYDAAVAEEERAAERERVDTFWAVFFLDRVVSSGTGRRSTLQDDDIELSFPPLDLLDPKTGWPSPFPALIRIVCLYGRVADLLNGIKEPSDITAETPQKLAEMEARVTNFYQGLSPKLHFQAMNFHHYVKAGEGTNFVLLHFWFHTLIVLLHQPTLLKTFEGKMLQLFPNSQALSMSSAKTIADILSYSQLIDTKAGLGNPFTTQPIYIAACAFLKETAEQTATSKEHSRSQSSANSRAGSPARDQQSQAGASIAEMANMTRPSSMLANSNRQPMVERALARHTLLATAANQHYQLCYKALQSVETYWGGTKYIITVLDQKFKGVGDPLLYTAEEGESAFEPPEPKPAFNQPGWRKKSTPNPWSPSALMQSSFMQARSPPAVGEANQPIGWTLTGTLNSPNTNVAWHFSGANGNQEHVQQSLDSVLDSNNPFDLNNMPINSPSSFHQPQNHHIRTYSGNSIPRSSTQQRSHRPSLPASAFATIAPSPPTFSSPLTQRQPNNENSSLHVPVDSFNQQSEMLNLNQGEDSFGDFLIESQDVDMSLLGLDVLPWFDALGGDLMPIFDDDEIDLRDTDDGLE
ncbi:hypothetical protein D6C78_10655 [Aureobasidium pullulans]|uniref:Zn(2)-C6 fungal-type domain-containing protein n=1 Tax=Aureobasidium pullulans TaxID=5580 RepID=A0A4T0B3T8_AURPU|nr:hypothetical protein D6C78_10655 [Aureobasidium pullulans]